MNGRWRGAIAAFFVSSLMLFNPAWAIAAPDLAPGETVLPDGLTTLVKHATGAGAVALEIWVKCPASGWSPVHPGIARLTALATLSAKSGGSSLRDTVRTHGGQIGISVFQTTTEFAVLAPANDAAALQEALLRAVFHPSYDEGALDDARARLAEEQAQAAQSTGEVLRDGVFAATFADGPLHDSTFGDPNTLKLTLADVRDFAARAYTGSASAAIALGNAGTSDITAKIAAGAPAASTFAALPASSVAPVPAQPITIPSATADLPGVALAWAGPPISDERAATAMDFLSDYLTDATDGVLSRAAGAGKGEVETGGQFVTLEARGLFFATAAGAAMQPLAMAKTLRDALAPTLASPLSADRFKQALNAYETRLLRQMDSPQGLADNYGWYIVQGAPAYAPSATDAGMTGRYFADAASLTPEFVHDVARRFLGAAPIVIAVTPTKPVLKISQGSLSQ